MSPGILSVDELKALSDAKDLLAKAQIKLYDSEGKLSEAGKRKLENVSRALGERTRKERAHIQRIDL